MNSRNVLFPIGFRFQPTDEELVKYFLLRKINGGAMNQDGKIKDTDIYNHEPIELYGMYGFQVLYNRMHLYNLYWELSLDFYNEFLSFTF